MESASYFAKKHGLEQYLDRPAELNELIFKLLILQESLQNERTRVKRNAGAGAGEETISIRRTVAGKFTAASIGDSRYRYAVETALRGSTATIAVFQRARFIKMLSDMGVPGERIAEYCDTVTLDDDTQVIDRE